MPRVLHREGREREGELEFKKRDKRGKGVLCRFSRFVPLFPWYLSALFQKRNENKQKNARLCFARFEGRQTMKITKRRKAPPLQKNKKRTPPQWLHYMQRTVANDRPAISRGDQEKSSSDVHALANPIGKRNKGRDEITVYCSVRQRDAISIPS